MATNSDDVITGYLCLYCDNNQYLLDNGLYYCTECSMQTQSVQALDEMDFSQSNFRILSNTNSKTKSKKKTISGDKNEKIKYKNRPNDQIKLAEEKVKSFQKILKILVRKISQLGKGNTKFQQTVGQLWFKLLEYHNVHKKSTHAWSVSGLECSFLLSLLVIAGWYCNTGITVLELLRWVRTAELPYIKLALQLQMQVGCQSKIQISGPDNIELLEMSEKLGLAIKSLKLDPKPIFSTFLKILRLPLCLTRYLLLLVDLIGRKNSSWLLNEFHNSWTNVGIKSTNNVATALRSKYFHLTEGKCLCLIIVLMRIIYTFDGEAEISLAQHWIHKPLIRKEWRPEMDFDDTEDGYFPAWNDWVDLVSIDTMLQEEFIFSMEESMFPHFNSHEFVLAIADAGLSRSKDSPYQYTTPYTTKIDSINEAFLKAKKKNWTKIEKIQQKMENFTCHKTKNEMCREILKTEKKQLMENMKMIKMDTYFEKNTKVIKDFAVLIYKYQVCDHLDTEIIPSSYRFLLQICGELIDCTMNEMFMAVEIVMKYVIESANLIVLENKY